MPENDGDQQAGQVVEESFEFDPNTGKSDQKAVETTQEAKTDESQTQEEANNQTDKSEEKDESDKGMSGEEMRLHHQALDLISNVLDMENKEKAKQFFAEHPELAEKANKSKKYKDSYRELIESKAEVKVESEETEKVTKENTDDTIDEDELTNRIMAKATEKGLIAERKSKAEKFAIANGINIDNLDVLYESAEAMRKASSLSFEKCLIGAKTALEGSDSKSVDFDTSKKGVHVEKSDKESEIKRIMKEHNVDRRTAEKYFDRKDDTDINEGGWREY